MNINTRNWFCCYLRTVLVICANNLAIDTYLYSLCLEWESNPYGRFGPRDFLTTMAFATISVCGPDYTFTMDHYSLGVPCLVSAPSSFQRLGSRLPSALSVKVSLNLRHSTSLFSESALKCALPR